MAVLKRFSYDNIVEHNPTAPDPVEGGGGSGGDGGGVYIVHGNIDYGEDEPTTTVTETFADIIEAISSGKLPVLYLTSGSEPSYSVYNYFSFEDDDGEIGVEFRRLSGHVTQQNKAVFDFQSIYISSEGAHYDHTSATVNATVG